MNYKKFLLVILFLFIPKVNAVEIINLASVNNYSITNYDVQKEIRFKELLNNKINKNQYNRIIQELIQDKIKFLETVDIKLDTEDSKRINAQFSLLVKNARIENKLDENMKGYIKKKIEQSYRWNKLINIKFSSKLTVNLNEIDKITSDNKMNQKQQETLILNKKNEKLITFSQTYFNEVKRKYLINLN